MVHSEHDLLRLSTRTHSTGGPRLRRLVLLTKHRIALGEADVRGWIVFTEDGQRVGRVRDLIIDVHLLAVRYLEIILDSHFADTISSRRAIVPVACARVSANRNHVHVRGVTSQELRHAPAFGARPIGKAEEERLRRFYLRSSSTPADHEGSDMRARVLHEQQRFFGIRRQGRWDAPYLSRVSDNPRE